MPRGYRGGVTYLGFGKYKCPECGKAKTRAGFLQRRTQGEKLNYSRCNACEYRRHQKQYYESRVERDPDLFRRRYARSEKAKKAKERAEAQARLEEEVAELGITNQQIVEHSGMLAQRVSRAFRPGARWSTGFIEQIESVVATFRDAISDEEDWEHGDSELPAERAESE
jgi:hypothetical protein